MNPRSREAVLSRSSSTGTYPSELDPRLLDFTLSGVRKAYGLYSSTEKKCCARDVGMFILPPEPKIANTV